MHFFSRSRSGAAAVEALRRGSDDAWIDLYRTLAPTIIGYARARGAADPEDIAGEVFTQVVRDLPRFEGDETALRSWIFTIAHRRVLDSARRARRRPVELAPPERLEAEAGAVDGEALAAASLDQASVLRLMRQLTEEQQTVVLLRVIGDLTVEEVAVVMAKRPGAVKALQRRALAALREQLDGGA